MSCDVTVGKVITKLVVSDRPCDAESIGLHLWVFVRLRNTLLCDLGFGS